MGDDGAVGVAASLVARAGTDRTVELTVRGVVLTGALLAISGSAVMIAAGRLDGWLSSGSALLGVVALGFGAAALSAARYPPGKWAAWALAASALAGLAVACTAGISHLTGSEPSLTGDLGDVPPELSATVTWLRSIALAASTVAVLVPLTFGFLLFPDGSLPSRRWRAAGLLAGLAVGGLCVARLEAIQTGPSNDVLGSPALRSALLASGLAVVVAFAALARGLGSGPGVARQQSKWVVWGAAVCAVAFAGAIALAGHADHGIATLLPASGILVLTGAYVVAMRRLWLHEIDLVISRTIVYAALGAFVVVVSAGSLIVASGLFGGGDELGIVAAIAVTTGIAAGFRPLRARLQAGVERTVSGRTATPHRVLSEFSRRVAASGEDPLSVVARSLVEGTAAIRAQVWLETGGDRIKAAEWPAGPWAGPGEGSRFAISHGGDTLGALVLDVPAGGRLTFQDHDLAEQVAAGLGLAIRNGMLARTLEQRVTWLRASRRRLIARQDEARRRLERDLHDGAQQQLVALRVKLGLARVMAGRDGATSVGAVIDELALLSETAIDALRELARGVYPPLLEVEGLAASIAAEARRAPFPTTLRLSDLGRYHRDVEGTVYLCIVEGLREVAQAGAGDEVVVTVAETDGRLRFEVRFKESPVGELGSGPTRPPATRLAALADRVDALSGELSVGSSPDTPAAILAGAIPIDDGIAP
jgi:signal transduction histidine kinase